ncbi:MAG: CARDB domain-containing protein [Methanofastidiosum sp.]
MGKYKKFLLLPILIIMVLGTIPLIYSDSTEEYYMLTLINNERHAQGLEPLTMNSTLSSAAKLHSQDMINRNFFNHINPDGLTPSDRARNAGYSFIALAENICGNPSIDSGHSSLMGSPSHRVNILNPSYKEVGIGIVDGGPYGKMITQLFGTQSENTVTTPTTTPQEPQGKPDLKIEKIDFSGQAEPLKQISIKITLINSGKKNSGNFVFAVFEGPLEKGNQLGKINIPSLYVGQTITANFNWAPPTEGSYTIYFVTDYNKDIDEENENNNMATYPLSVKLTNSQTTSEENPSNQNNKSDLYISKSDISYNQIVYEGESSLISFRIRNIGKSTAFVIPIKIYANGELKASSTINQILPSSYTDLALYLTFSNTGENVIDIKIDPDNSIDEISKNNNYANFNIKVVPRENNSIATPDSNQNNKQIYQNIDLLVYPYYITIEEQGNGFFSIKTKIKNKGITSVDNFSVTIYQRDTNTSNNTFIERFYLSLGPDQIVEKIITFIPTTEKGEIVVVIDEENIIKEMDKNNNIATKKFSNIINESDIPEMRSDFILNTTPQDVNISNLLKVTMKLKDINSSNAYLYYKYDEDINSSFFVLKMNNEGNYSYLAEVEPLGKTNLFYYFEVDTGNNIIKSPYESPNELYSTIINYQQNIQEKRNPSFLDNVRKIFGLI